MYTPEFEKTVHAIGDGLNQLAALGNAPRVAAFLQERKVRGVPRSGTSCPVRLFLPDADADTVRVDTHSTFVRRGDEKLSIVNPLPVSEFIAAFDHGEYPDLVG